MTVEMAWGEDISVIMESGVPVDGFTIGSATLGVIGEDFIGGTFLVDVTEFVTNISTSRGRTDQLQQFNAGSISITLNNSDRRFDPTNTDSPYYNSTTGRFTLTPRKRIFVYSNGEPLFTGSITDLNIEYKPQSVTAATDISTVTVSASDDFVLLANTFINPEYEPVQTLSGNRLIDVLQLPSVDFPTSLYNIPLNYGVSVLGGTAFNAAFTVPAGTNALQYVQKINEAEQGYLFINAAGQLTFIERLEPQYQTSEAEFSDDGTDIPYNTLAVMFGQEQLYNDITITNVSGAEFSLTDATSIADYGLSTFDLTDTLLADSAGTEQLDLLAQNLLLRYKQPAYRFDKMTVTYNGLSSAKQLSLSQLELADIITITRTYPVGTPASVTQQYSVESLRHMISPSSHRVEIGLAVAPLAFPFILGGYTTTTTRTNLLTNPNFETNTTGWGAIGTGTTITRITTDAYVGSACLQVSTGTVANSAAITSSSPAASRTPVTAGQPYYLSAYVKVPTGQPSVSLRLRTLEFQADGTQNANQVSSTVIVSDVDGWVRLSFADTPTAGATPTVTMSFRVEVPTTVARIYLVDAVLFEQSSTLLPYFDGTYADTYTGYTLTEQAWNGTADASTSTATWRLDSSFVLGSTLSEIYALS